MEFWQKFMEKQKTLSDLLENYRSMRMLFRKLGFTDADLESPPTYNHEMFARKDLMTELIDKLVKEMNIFGFDEPRERYMDFLREKFEDIDRLIPMHPINKKKSQRRGNSK